MWDTRKVYCETRRRIIRAATMKGDSTNQIGRCSVRMRYQERLTVDSQGTVHATYKPPRYGYRRRPWTLMGYWTSAHRALWPVYL